jgi:thiosulfate dehydrogenase [quinone] large subunit
MQASSSPSGAVESTKVASVSTSAPLVLGERSLLLMALFRIFVGLLWFQQLAWKMPPTFAGLHGYVVKEAQYTFVPGYSFILNNVFLTHFILLGALVWSAECLVGLLLIFGLFSRLGGLLAMVLSLQLYVGLAYAPGEWYWTYGMLVLIGLALIAVPSGRRLGLDQLLAPRVQAAAHKSVLARFASWWV